MISALQHGPNGFLRKVMEKELRISGEVYEVELVKVSPLQLGIDGALFRDHYRMEYEKALRYICKRASEHGFMPCDTEIMLQLCLQKHEPFDVVMASIVERLTPNEMWLECPYGDFVRIIKKPAQCELKFNSRIVAADDKFVFHRLRPQSTNKE